MSAINHLTLRSTLVYTTPGILPPPGSFMTTDVNGKQYPTNNLIVNTGIYSTLTGSTITTSSIVTPAIVGTVTLGQNATYPNRFIELGTDAANSMYLDFHSNDSQLPDYSTRIQSVGGATTGTGNLNLYGSTIGLMGTAGVGIGKTNPGYALDVAGTVNISGSYYVNGAPMSSSQWATSGSNISYTAGNVGIGTATPSDTLHVNGNIRTNLSYSQVCSYSLVSGTHTSKWYKLASFSGTTYGEYLMTWDVSGEHGEIKFTVGFSYNGCPTIIITSSVIWSGPAIQQLRIATDPASIYNTAYIEFYTNSSFFATISNLTCYLLTVSPVSGSVTLYQTLTAGTTGFTYYPVQVASTYAMNTSGGIFTILSGGNVGIGSASPGNTLDVAGTIQAQTAFQSVASASNVGLGALQQVYLGQYGAAAPRGTLVRWGDILGAAYHVTTGGCHLSFYKDVSGGNAALALQIVGTTISNATPNIYIPNQLGVGTASPGGMMEIRGNSTIQNTLNVYGSTAFDASNYLLMQCQASSYGRNQLIMVGRYESSNDGWSLNGARNGIRFATQSSLNSATTDRFTIQNFASQLGVLSASGGTNPVQVWNDNGYVGIGSSQPANYLDVQGYIQIGNNNTNYDNITFTRGTTAGSYPNICCQTNYIALYTSSSGGWCTDSAAGDIVFRTASNSVRFSTNSGSSSTFVINGSSGYIGINTSTASCPLHVNATLQSTATGYYVYFSSGQAVQYAASAAFPISIYAMKAIVSGNSIASLTSITFSDVRMKKNIKPLDDALGILNNLKVVSYDHIDCQDKSVVAGVVAQEVEKVLPNCVTHMKRYLPNIYEMPASYNVINEKVVIRLTKGFSADVKAGVNVRLMVGLNAAEKKEEEVDTIIHECTEYTITVDKWKSFDEMEGFFVYGTEVNDFQTVDKVQLGLLSVRGVQQLHDIITSQQDHISQLETKLASQTAKLDALLAWAANQGFSG